MTKINGFAANTNTVSLLKIREGAIRAFLIFCAGFSVLVTTGIVVVLVKESLPFFKEVAVHKFLFGTQWEALSMPPKFGILPLMWGTFEISLGALILAVPTGIATAIFLSEYAPQWVRQGLKPVIEILAGIPSVVFGYFALSFITPIMLKQWVPAALGWLSSAPLVGNWAAQLQLRFSEMSLFNALSASIVLAIMILPTIVSLCDDAFRAVPRGLREGAYALSATKLEVSARIVFPAALSGVVAAILLALARAIGETMAVTLAAGSRATLSANPLNSVQTMTAYIVQICQGDAEAHSVEYYSIYAVGLTLFLITLGVNLVAQRTLARFKEKYE